MMLKMMTVKRVKPIKAFCQSSVLTLVKTSLTMKTTMITICGEGISLLLTSDLTVGDTWDDGWWIKKWGIGQQIKMIRIQIPHIKTN